ncbi:surface antigen 2 (CA-2), partial [Trypanosoma conorhini]
MASHPTRLDAVCEAVHGDFASCGAASLQELCRQVRLLRANVQRLAFEQIPSLDVDITALQEPHLHLSMRTNLRAVVEGNVSTPGNAIVGAESLLSHCKQLTTDCARGSHRLPDKQRLPTTMYAVGYTPHYHQRNLPSFGSTESTERGTIEKQSQQRTPSAQRTQTKSSIQEKETASRETLQQLSSEKSKQTQPFLANKQLQTRQPTEHTRDIKPSPFGQAATGSKAAPFGQSVTGDKAAPFGQAATGDKAAPFGQAATGGTPQTPAFGQAVVGDKAAPFGQAATGGTA